MHRCYIKRFIVSFIGNVCFIGGSTVASTFISVASYTRLSTTHTTCYC